MLKGRMVTVPSCPFSPHVLLGGSVPGDGERFCLALGFPKGKGSMSAPSLIVSNHGGAFLIGFQKWDRGGNPPSPRLS